jgi:periplasmic protein TonB
MSMGVMETKGVASLSNKPLFMEPNQIKDAHFLDILFEGRNKEYGAYELRKSYNRRIVKALFAMGAVVGLLFLGSVVSGFGKGVRVAPADVTDVLLAKVEEPKPVVVPPPPRIVPPPPVAMRIFTPPLIVKDADVKPPDTPPVNDDLDKVKIGTVNTPGGDDVGAPGPPAGSGVPAGVVVAPTKTDDQPLMVVEIEAGYPGGLPAWARFLNKNLRYPDDGLNNGIAGTVMVQFVVDLEGNVSDIQAIGGPESGGLREEAIRVIKKSGKWDPAIQNGRHVKAYRRQPVTFVQGDGN